MAKLNCSACGFQYEPRGVKETVKRCPYCSREGSMRKTKQMQEWIDDVEQMTSNFIG